MNISCVINVGFNFFDYKCCHEQGRLEDANQRAIVSLNVFCGLKVLTFPQKKRTRVHQ